MKTAAILGVALGLAWGILTYRMGASTDLESARRRALRFALGGTVLAFAVLDWIRITLRPWL